MTAEELTSLFHEQFASLKDQGLIVTGIAGALEIKEGKNLSIGIAQIAEDYEEVSPESHRISVIHPFIFDGRKLPDSFMGFKISKVYMSKSIPPEIDKPVLDPAGFKTSWTPDQFRKYVHKNASRIRLLLDDPEMTEDDILDAVSQGDFNKFCDAYEERRIKRLIGE